MLVALLRSCIWDSCAGPGLVKTSKCSGLLGISNGTPGLQVVDRVRRKAAMYGQDEVNDDHFNPFSSNGAESPSYKVEPETVAQLYEQFVMPLTKEVQLTYLLHRLDHEMRPQLQ